MSDIAIRVEGLSKQYRIGRREQYATLRDRLTAAVTAPFRRLRSTFQPSNLQPSNEDTIWALKDVSFDVKQGEVVGVIGRNGAGKSTLLKILSRITGPTAGRVEVFGRVGSLLEVGTGFHPELTGRENIYLNGAILGMRKAEIDRKFDTIVAFAEIEKFLDTPVRHYSSGMYVRLAFAVAAHLEQEILLVDEVLAVGDVHFQKKCLGKMADVARSGRTVLFVSHNMNAVTRLCTKAILLTAGAIKISGEAAACIKEYSGEYAAIPLNQWKRRDDGRQAPLTVRGVQLRCDSDSHPRKLTVSVDLLSCGGHRAAFLAFDIHDASGMAVMQALPTCDPFISGTPGDKRATCEINLPPLIPGTYSITIWVGPHNTETLDLVKHVVAFEVTESPTPRRTFPHTPDHGHVVPDSTVVQYVD